LEERQIRVVENFLELYELGKEVMPSAHPYMRVHFATRRKDRHACVVKVRFKPQCFKSRDDERSWRQNTEFLLNMPDNGGVVQIYEVLEDAKALYIVMEKVEGMDLFEMLEQGDKVTVEMARDILRQLLQSMLHLHAHNAVHKDLTLENVMIDISPKSSKSPSSSPGSVKVIDFDTLEEWAPNSPKAKDVLGTDQYIAQEAYAGKYTPLSDIFAVGVIAYRLLTGEFPFHGKIFDDDVGENWVGSPKMAQIRERLRVAQIDFSQRVFRENPHAKDLIMKMLAYSERKRPTAAQALEHPWFENCPLFPSAEASTTWSAGCVCDLPRFDESSALAEEAVVGEERRLFLVR
jgi:calcium-dependent protein kinase